ncbi:MAG: lactate utilization iron-sulfur protein LutA [Candidatus Abyssubacteria bacterium]
MSQVSLFVPCLVDLFMPEVGEASLLLLRRLGLEPIYHKEQTCCGQPFINTGYLKQARKTAKHFIEVFENDSAIVCPSGSCVYTVKNRYLNLFTEEPAWHRRATELAPRVYELSQYIVDALNIEDVGASFRGKITYHASCQLYRGLGVSEQPKKLIKAVKGAEFVPLPQEHMCCGFGGEFSTGYPEISEALVSAKAANYLASEADVLVACEPGCLLNIGGYLKRRHPDKKVMHIACLLTENGS